MSCDIGKVAEGLENELWCRWSKGISSAHSPTFLSLYLRHNSFSNPCCFTYITAHYPTLLSLHLRHNSFSNPPLASPTSQALHLRHLTSLPWRIWNNTLKKKNEIKNTSDETIIQYWNWKLIQIHLPPNQYIIGPMYDSLCIWNWILRYSITKYRNHKDPVCFIS